jgi:hypothetical protein
LGVIVQHVVDEIAQVLWKTSDFACTFTHTFQ